MKIPKYILKNCKNKYIISCDYFMHKDCKNTCGYAFDMGLGIGAPTEPPEGLVDKLNKDKEE